MHTVIRTYRSTELADALAEHESEVQRLISETPGFQRYDLLRAGDTTVSITTCDNREGCEESSRRARDWVRENLPQLAETAPETISGESVMHFQGQLQRT